MLILSSHLSLCLSGFPTKSLLEYTCHLAQVCHFSTCLCIKWVQRVSLTRFWTQNTFQGVDEVWCEDTCASTLATLFFLLPLQLSAFSGSLERARVTSAFPSPTFRKTFVAERQFLRHEFSRLCTHWTDLKFCKCSRVRVQEPPKSDFPL